MTMYAPTSVPALAFNPEVGGCGNTHERGAKDSHLEVNCPQCEPLIVKYLDGWGATPGQATLTDVEEAELKAQHDRGTALVNASGTALGEMLAQLAAEKQQDNKRKTK